MSPWFAPGSKAAHLLKTCNLACTANGCYVVTVHCCLPVQAIIYLWPYMWFGNLDAYLGYAIWANIHVHSTSVVWQAMCQSLIKLLIWQKTIKTSMPYPPDTLPSWLYFTFSKNRDFLHQCIYSTSSFFFSQRLVFEYSNYLFTTL